MNSPVKYGKLTVFEFRSRTDLGLKAATMVSDKIRDLLSERDVISIIFAAAPSQNEFLESLSIQPDVDWSRIVAFHMDEYIHLHEDAPQRFGNFLKNRIFDRLPFKFIYYIDGNAPNLAEECQRYSNLLKLYPVDIVCMGIGENCHIAFNDPHVADFNDRSSIKVVDLDLSCRQQQVNDGCFNTLNEVPTHALTLTIPALVKASSIFCMVPGMNKATAVYNTLNAAINEQFPATILRQHENANLFIDKDSSSKLTI